MYIGYKFSPSYMMYSSANLISAFYLIYTLFINSSFSVYCLRLLIPRFIRIPLKYAGFFCYCFCFRKQKKIEINCKSLPLWRASVLEDSPCIPTGSLSLSISHWRRQLHQLCQPKRVHGAAPLQMNCKDSGSRSIQVRFCSALKRTHPFLPTASWLFLDIPKDKVS